MAGIAYERYEAEIEAADVDTDSESQDSHEDAAEARLINQQHSREWTEVHEEFSAEQREYYDVFHGTGLLCISAVIATLGFILTALGMVETVLLPLLNRTDENKIFWLEKFNCFGVILWAGIWLVLTSSCGLRAAISKSILFANIFFSVVLLNLILYSVALVIVLVGYTSGWTTEEVFRSDQAFFYVHISSTIILCISFAVLILAFTRFYEDVFCDRLMLFKHCVHCCCPCWCPRPVSRDELLDDAVVPPDQRPPSIPI